MKISEVPKEAYDQKSTKIPTKKVVTPDWAVLYEIVVKQGYVIIDCDEDDLRVTTLGGEESPLVKAFNSWMRNNFNRHVRSKRIGATRWYVTL